MFIIAGPCVVENFRIAMETAERLKRISEELGVEIIYKSSYDKANRSSIDSFRGVGYMKALSILERVKDTFGMRILTDVHTDTQAVGVAGVADILQVPAFLCRQTDLLLAVAEQDRITNVKVGQFIQPQAVGNIVEKLRTKTDKEIWLTYRGYTFGYGNLIVDMRAFPIMAQARPDTKIVFDATHSVQMPGAEGTYSGGDRSFVPVLARAAVATGFVDGVFMEVHPDPENALCDKDCQLKLKDVKGIIEDLLGIYKLGEERISAGH